MPKRTVATCLLLALACALPLPAAAGDGAPMPVAMAAAHPVALSPGRPLLVNFWATWCTPCRAEIPALVAAYESGAVRDLALVGVALDDDEQGVRDFAAAHAMTYPQLSGKERGLALMRELGNDRQAVPFTVAIDRHGNIVAKQFGLLRRADLARLLLALQDK